MKRSIVLFIVLAILSDVLYFSAQALASRDDLVVKGTSKKPIIISLNSLGIATKEIISLNPYKVEIKGIKDELEIYRKLYLFLNVVFMFAFINAISAR